MDVPFLVGLAGGSLAETIEKSNKQQCDQFALSPLKKYMETILLSRQILPLLNGAVIRMLVVRIPFTERKLTRLF